MEMQNKHIFCKVGEFYEEFKQERKYIELTEDGLDIFISKPDVTEENIQQIHNGLRMTGKQVKKNLAILVVAHGEHFPVYGLFSSTDDYMAIIAKFVTRWNNDKTATFDTNTFLADSNTGELKVIYSYTFSLGALIPMLCNIGATEPLPKELLDYARVRNKITDEDCLKLLNMTRNGGI